MWGYFLYVSHEREGEILLTPYPRSITFRSPAFVIGRGYYGDEYDDYPSQDFQDDYYDPEYNDYSEDYYYEPDYDDFQDDYYYEPK